jgi:carboxylesterase
MPSSKYFDSNNYTFNSESKNGIYIIHGFTNTTYEIKELAYYLSEQGYYIVADNLPGHGTTVDDCNRCKYTDWIDFVEQGFAEMSSKCNNVFVVGISMGSVLALHLSTIFPLNAAVFGATVLQFKDYFGIRVLTPILHKIIHTRDKRLSYPPNIRNKIPYYGYPVWPMSAVNEMRKLSNKVKKGLSKVNVPALIIHSEKDKLQLPSNTSLVYNSISSDIKEKLILKNAGHNFFDNSPDQDMVFQKVGSFFNQFLDLKK